MGTRLYVGNLSHGATAEMVRARFAEHGGVADVEIAADRWGSPKGFAFVTMTSPAFAKAAIAQLDGAKLDGQPLRVNEAPTREVADTNCGVKIAMQFRERNNMTYDLDCAGAPLTVRIFPMPDEQWRIEARISDAVDAVIVSSSAKTRREALGDVGRSWGESALSRRVPTLDWEAITRAMTAIRAV